MRHPSSSDRRSRPYKDSESDKARKRTVQAKARAYKTAISENDSVRKNRLVCEDTFERFLRILPTINPILHEWTGSCWKIGTYAKGRNGSCNRNNIQESKRKLKTKREQYEEKMKPFFGQLLCGRENIKVDADLLFEMANRLGVSIPLRTKGWIRTSTITVSDGQVSAYQYSGGRSSAFFKYANQILSALQQLQSVV